jgi:predicted amidohydrolase/GNAT superfamily N-acetyltransferase
MAKNKKVKIRHWKKEDIPAIVECHKAAYPDFPSDSHHNKRIYTMQLNAFPEGQFLAEIDGKIIGYGTTLLIQLDDKSAWYTYSEITGDSTFSTHTPSGDTLYGADIAVHPDYRGQGIAGALYVHRKKLLKRYNLRRMVAYGRIPGFKQCAGKMTADEYVQAVVDRKLKDPALIAHLKAGYTVKRVLLDFVGDRSSMDYCTLLEMPNPDFNPEKRRIAASALRKPVRKVRVCAAQYMMRPIKAWDEFERNVKFFVDAADEYHCHFLVLPEFFTAELFSTMPHDLDSVSAMKELANLTPKYIELFKQQATKSSLYIIAGSQPVKRDGKLFNVAHLFTPSGNVYTQDKIHVTPSERAYFNIEPGENIHVFETPLAKIAIQVCYDIEFPEISQLMKRAGADIIFVPFSTDERKAYYRVRYTAQARAVENVVYVVISGNVGNLPNIKSYLINYGQSAIFTPSDFAFPMEAMAGEAEPNVETVVISDLDLTSLEQQKEIGSVRPLYDRRPDIYELIAKIPVKVIRTD